MGNEKKRQQKKKERERRTSAKIEHARTKRAQLDSRAKKAFAATEPLRDNMQAEILLQTLGYAISHKSIVDAKHLFEAMADIDSTHDAFGRWLDDLFAAANGKAVQRTVTASTPELTARSILASMKPTLARLTKQIEAILGSELGQKLWQMDAFESHLRAARQLRAQEIIDLSNREMDSYDKHLGRPLTEEERADSENPDLANIGDEMLVDSFMEPVVDGIALIRSWQMGVPADFYRSIVELGDAVSTSALFFFLRHVYQNILRQENLSLLMPFTDAFGMKRVGLFLKSHIAGLPDPEFLQSEGQLAGGLHALQGGESAVKAVEVFHEAGSSYAEATAKLARMGTGTLVYQTAMTLATSGVQSPFVMLSLCCDNPSFILAAEALHTCCNPAQVAEFLFSYGDYRIGERTLAETVHSLKHRPQAMQLIVENAFFFCCGEGSAEMADLLSDLSKGAKALRTYLRFCQLDAVYKQMALLRFLRLQGANGRFDAFVARLDLLSEDRVFEALCQDGPAFIDAVLLGEAQASPAPVHSARDLIAKYNLATEIESVSPETMNRVNESLEAVRGTRYESLLLGQARLRQRLFERLRENAAELISSLKVLPAEGNPYLSLKIALFPAETVSAPEVETKSDFKRIVIISARIPDTAVTFLRAETKTDVAMVSPDAAACRFDSIGCDDLVIYDTGQTGHSSYYLVKNLAVRRGARFLHATKVNRHALLDLVQQG